MEMTWDNIKGFLMQSLHDGTIRELSFSIDRDGRECLALSGKIDRDEFEAFCGRGAGGTAAKIDEVRRPRRAAAKR